MADKNQQITYPLDSISTQIIQKDLLVYQSKTTGSITVKINGINYTLITAGGISVTITTAKLTAGGATGSMTFTGGILTASTPAT